ncbi:glycerophosphodiester phosphodiesterase family protein [Hymenobacter cellulosilyticus]|uniref:Glycerophosphodiester phosphodiesterase n=1 Tax=Hymenobacter cellulosilyticus TaxID=2932248 RepID=A0A8T9PZJ6_9BACT|nr:glycerophosphodiester phosphodiesterase family protein [Hymenobacter cellulosilyticus]UOQ70175.1 glycerophosphodiester phosphodiesterase [Hymenobacter cellulosilyticus]
MTLRCVLFLLGLLTTLPALAQTPSFDRQGHRGCRGLMPENTIPAMRKALDLGVTTLEMDVLVSQDKQVLLSHDPYMNAAFVLTPQGQPLRKDEEQQHRLYGLPYAEIRRYDVGSLGNPKFPRQQKLRTYKPLLAEVIDSVEAYARSRHLPLPRYNIETKSTPAGDDVLHPAPAEFVQLLLSILVQKGIQQRVIIQSFDPRTLELVHRRYPSIATAMLVDNKLGWEKNLQRLSFRPTIYSPAYALVTAELVAACHQQHVQVIPWTVNSATAIEQLIRLQVDGIITDYPDLFTGF